MIAWRHPQILIGSRIIDHLELAKQPAFEIGREMPRLPILDEEGAQPLIPKAYDHAAARVCTYTPLLGTGTTLETLSRPLMPSRSIPRIWRRCSKGLRKQSDANLPRMTKSRLLSAALIREAAVHTACDA